MKLSAVLLFLLPLALSASLGLAGPVLREGQPAVSSLVHRTDADDTLTAGSGLTPRKFCEYWRGIRCRELRGPIQPLIRSLPLRLPSFVTVGNCLGEDPKSKCCKTFGCLLAAAARKMIGAAEEEGMVGRDDGDGAEDRAGTLA